MNSSIETAYIRLYYIIRVKTYRKNSLNIRTAEKYIFKKDMR